MALLAMVAVSSGCASQSNAQTPTMGAKAKQAASGNKMVKMDCAMCADGAPSPEKGTASVVNGVQVVNITLKDGYYSPNEITLKAGMPAKLVFTGESKACPGKPKIADLDKQADFTKTGEATMDLGTVNVGIYELTCGMGSAGGNIVVE